MFLSKPVRGLGIHGALKTLGFRLLKLGKILVKDLFLDTFVCLERGLMTLWIANIHLSDLGQNIESDFGLHGDGFLNGLLSGVFPIAMLLNLSTNKGL